MRQIVMGAARARHPRCGLHIDTGRRSSISAFGPITNDQSVPMVALAEAVLLQVHDGAIGRGCRRLQIVGLPGFGYFNLVCEDADRLEVIELS